MCHYHHHPLSHVKHTNTHKHAHTHTLAQSTHTHAHTLTKHTHTHARTHTQGASTEAREAAAEGLGEMVALTSQDALRPFVVQITGPLIRIIGDRFPSQASAPLPPVQACLCLLGLVPECACACVC